MTRRIPKPVDEGSRWSRRLPIRLACSQIRLSVSSVLRVPRIRNDRSLGVMKQDCARSLLRRRLDAWSQVTILDKPIVLRLLSFLSLFSKSRLSDVWEEERGCLEKRDRLNGVTGRLLNAHRYDQLMGGIVSLIVGSFIVKRGITLSPAIPLTLHQRCLKASHGVVRGVTRPRKEIARNDDGGENLSICAQFNRTIRLH